MKDINIAAATALQAIDPMGREKALKVGANVIMPNITPTLNRKNYHRITSYNVCYTKLLRYCIQLKPQI